VYAEVVMSLNPRLVPLLVVKGAAQAIDFYERAFGARELVRYVSNLRNTIDHADLCIGDATFSVTEEAPAWNSDAPPTLGGSPVVLQLEVDDVRALFDRICSAGAVVVFPLQEFCGELMCRVRDIYGHLWILRQRVEELSAEEIRKRRDAFAAQVAAKTRKMQE
jgi:PhnB protein